MQRFVVFEVVLELGPFLLLAGHHAGTQGGVVPQIVAQLLQQIGLLGEALHQDVAGTVEGGFAVGDPLLGIEEANRLLLGILHRVAQQQVGQRLQSRLDGHLPLVRRLGL